MFTEQIEDFGDFKKYKYADTAGNALELVPEHGACVLQVMLGGKPLLNGHTNPTALRNNDWGKSALLFPFPNRLRDGKYTFQGTDYQFPINETDNHNALHGFDLDRPFAFSQTNLSEHQAFIELHYDYDGSLAYYPFPFRFLIRFRLMDGRFELEMEMINIGSGELPAGLGWHPYFKITDQIEDTSLQLPQSEMILIDDRMIPTGEREPYATFAELKPIASTSLDNGFALAVLEGQAEVRLSCMEGELKYWQETGRGKYNFLQVFTPPMRNSIALEPMTCNIDAFNNKDGLAVLSPGQALRGKFGFSWKAAE